MGNEAAFAALDDMIATMRALPEVVEENIGPVAQAADASIRADAAAGIDPQTGAPWAPRKADGGRVMSGAAGAISMTVSGTKITWEIGPPYVFWHFGVKGAKPRHVIPWQPGMPAKLGLAVRRGFVAPWRKLTEGT